MKYFQDDINSSYIEISKKDDKNKIQLKNDSEDNDKENNDIQDIKQMGVPNMPQQSKKDIQCITIIGEIEGHYIGNPQKKATK